MQKQVFDKKEPELVEIDRLFSKSIKKPFKPNKQTKEMINDILAPNRQIKELIDLVYKSIKTTPLPSEQVKELINKISVKHPNIVNFLK